MRNKSRLFRALPWFVFVVSAAVAPVYGEDAGGTRPLDAAGAMAALENNCVYCHGGNEPEAGFNVETLRASAVDENLEAWKLIVQRVAANEMPPKNAFPMEDGERESFVEWARNAMREAACGDGIDPGPAPLRRLNRHEYSATIRDLLYIHFDAGHGLPADGAGGAGFDNAAETLFISPVHLERYLEAVAEALDYAMKEAEARERLVTHYPDAELMPNEAARLVLGRFLERAFRRPVSGDETTRYVNLFQLAAERGELYEAAVFHAMRAALISPDFLFLLEEPNPAPEMRRVSQYEFASRLSYFLWSGMPDEELFKLAEAGKLFDQTVLRGQIERMLEEPNMIVNRRRDDYTLDNRKAHAFASSFVSQWLGTRELGRDSRPDRNLFPRYDQELESAMQYEPVYVFQELVTRDESLLNLIDSDFTFLNRHLSRLYGIEKEVEAESRQLERVSLPEGSRRGGVMTMAGPLAVGSFPNRTSPVLRGKWVLETLLGTPPPPPPPNVPELPENREGEPPKTLRERLMTHRENPVCASCHDRIDPIGFGLENFDAIGRWRDEDAGRPIDASGQLPDGSAFEGPDALKAILMDRKDDFIRHLTEKMLGYALGRGLVLEDHCTVEAIVEKLKANGYRARVLIWEIVNSVPFQYRPPNENAPDFDAGS